MGIGKLDFKNGLLKAQGFLKPFQNAKISLEKKNSKKSIINIQNLNKINKIVKNS